MKPPKRQIIKTRPQHPYIVARIVLIVLALVALLLAVLLLSKPHVHAAALPALLLALQEAPFAARTAPIPVTTEHRAHEHLRQR